MGLNQFEKEHALGGYWDRHLKKMKDMFNIEMPRDEYIEYLAEIMGKMGGEHNTMVTRRLGPKNVYPAPIYGVN